MTTGDWVSAVQNAVQAAAIIVGGIWAYWKFVRGRTFHRRAEVSVDASLIVVEVPRVVRAKLTLTNTGASEIPKRAAVLSVYAFAPGEIDSVTKAPDWLRIAYTGVFLDHEWVESQELITDDVLLELEPANDHLGAVALRATCVVLAKPKRTVRRRNRNAAWTSNSVMLTAKEPSSADANGEGVTAMPNDRTYQRSPSDDEADRIEREAREREEKEKREREERQRRVSEEEAQRIEKESKEKK